MLSMLSMAERAALEQAVAKLFAAWVHPGAAGHDPKQGSDRG